MSLGKRTVTAVGWNSIASLTNLVLVFARAVVLARLLPVDTYGVYAFGSSIVGITIAFANFGMGGAFMHRSTETEDENHAAAVHFTLKLIFVSVWAALMLVGAFVFADGILRTVIVVLTLTTAGLQMTQTPQLILRRRVVHRKLALVESLNTIATTAVAIVLAWRGATIGALLATNLTTMLLYNILLYGPRPVWRPQLKWHMPSISYYLRFGSRNLGAQLTARGLSEIDDIWTGSFLGATALGYYSRAYRFASFPRQLVAKPVNEVTSGTFAALKGKRRQLSQVFFRANAILVRSGFLLAGAMALIAPEFIRIVLGAKWLPMLEVFRLMLVFTLLDPLKVTMASLFIAVGRPGIVFRLRLIQLAVLIVGLFILGFALGTKGVALAVNIMLVVGISLFLLYSREYVDISIRKLFAVPSLALVVGLLLALTPTMILGTSGSDWTTATVKIVVFVPVYSGLLFMFEKEETLKMLVLAKRMYKGDVRQ